MKRCPNCLSDQFEHQITIAREPHSEILEQEFLECWECGSRFLESDLIELPEILVTIYPADEIALEGDDN